MNQILYLKDVATLRLDRDKCVGCGMCRTVCPHDVFAEDGNRVRIANRDACMECGACAMNCPVEAIFVQPGVGCAAAVINSMLGRTGASCCCSIDPRPVPGAPAGCGEKSGGPTCC